MRIVSFALCAMLLTAPQVDAQQITHPQRGSALRAQLLDTARPVFERDTGGRIEFIVRHLNVLGDWAIGHLRTCNSLGRAEP